MSQGENVSDLTYPDFSKLLVQAIARLTKQGLVEFTDLEKVVVGHIVALSTDRLDAIGDRVTYEIDDLGIPKWVCLVTWLNPFGLVSSHPKLVLRIAQYMLGYSTTKEEAMIPADIRAQMGV